MKVGIELINIGETSKDMYLPDRFKADPAAEFRLTINGTQSTFIVPLPRGTRIDDPNIGKILRDHCHEAFKEIVKQTEHWAIPPSE